MWDTYKADSLKALTRVNEGVTPIRRSVYQLAAIPKYWQINKNYMYFIIFPTAMFLGHKMPTKKQLPQIEIRCRTITV